MEMFNVNLKFILTFCWRTRTLPEFSHQLPWMLSWQYNKWELDQTPVCSRRWHPARWLISKDNRTVDETVIRWLNLNSDSTAHGLKTCG